MGDFLAGIFAPVAFLWLILGYIQQGKQLEQNTRALEQQEQALQLQIEEMRESVRQQKELSRIQNEQLTMAKNSLAHNFEIKTFKLLNQDINGEGILFECDWGNLGSNVFDVEISINLIDEVQ